MTTWRYVHSVTCGRIFRPHTISARNKVTYVRTRLRFDVCVDLETHCFHGARLGDRGEWEEVVMGLPLASLYPASSGDSHLLHDSIYVSRAFHKLNNKNNLSISLIPAATLVLQ